MESIRELQEQLVVQEAQQPTTADGPSERIVVLKQYRFHKALSIELYDAAITQSGKLKNPLFPLNPLDLALATADTAMLQFYACISRFQNNPTATRTPADIAALKTIVANAPRLRFFYHNPDFSEKVVAGSLKEVSLGAPLNDLSLLVNKTDAFYDIRPQLLVNGTQCSVATLELKFDYFVLLNGTLHLLANLQIIKLVHYFRQRGLLRLHPAGFQAFRTEVLAKIENQVSIVYTYIQAATDDQLAEGGLQGAQEKIIYLSDEGPYVLINPVMRYGPVEVPVLSKRPVHVQDAKGAWFSMERNEAAELRFTALLLQQHPDFAPQLDTDPMHFYLHRNRFLDENWFLQAFANWREAGISIFGFNQLRGNKRNEHKAQITVQVTSGINWFNTNLKVLFGKKTAALKQVHQAVRNSNRYVQLDDGTEGILPQDWMERLASFFEAGTIEGDELLLPKFQFPTIAQLFAAAEVDNEVKTEILQYQVSLSKPDALELVPPPEGLQTTLRHYQQQGLSWLAFLDQHNFGGCLADDMGLGKTVQVIAFMLLRKTRQPGATHLLVVPTSLIFNWQVELQRFAPSLQLLTLYGANRKRDHRLFAPYDVVLTSYGTLLSDVSFLRNFRFDYIFLDESQQIKNITSQRYHAARVLQSRNKIAITGTPIENNTLDLYAQLSFACPGLLGNSRYFRDVYSTPIDKFQDSRRRTELQRKVAPFILRRTKEAVARELPEKTETVLYCPMGEAQRKVYESYERELREYIEGKPQDALLQHSIHVLRGLTQLRQICNAPALLATEGLQGDGSSKIAALMEQIESKAPVHKVLVFSQFVGMLELIRKELEKTGLPYAYLTGSTQNRQEQVDRFQEDPAVRVFLVSLKAGGMGLNLTAAEYVYLVDPWWNPAVENQAIDRAYRIGQHRNVMAVRLICPDTVEEKILKLQQTKRALSEVLIRNDHDFFAQVTREDWLSLLQPTT